MISLKTRGAGFVTCPRSEQWGTDLAPLAGKENGWVHRSRSHFDGARTFLSNAARICFQTSPAKPGHIIVPEGHTIIAQRFNLRNASSTREVVSKGLSA